MRLRPILMTTLAMIFGMLPLALGARARAAELRAPMARAVIGGLITSTMLTLLVVPVVYSFLDDFGNRVRQKWEGKSQARAVVAVLCFLAVVPGVFVPSAGAADTDAVEVLTLEEALRTAVASNRDVGKAMELRTSLEGKYVVERAAALPQFLATAEALRAWDGIQTVFGAPPGSDRFTAEVGVSQPLYSSGVVSAGIRAAVKGLATADDQLRIVRQAVLRDVYAAFHNILLWRELNRIAIEDRVQKARGIDQARKKYAVGTGTDYDVLAAEVALQNAAPEAVRTENLVRVSRERLRFLLGSDRKAVDAKETSRPWWAILRGYDEAFAVAVNHRPELTDLRNRQGVARELLGIARAGNRPRAGLPRRSRLAGGRLRDRRRQRKNMVRLACSPPGPSSTGSGRGAASPRRAAMCARSGSRRRSSWTPSPSKCATR